MDDRRQQAVEMLRDGIKYREVSERLGVPITTLHRWAQREGIARRPRLTPEQVDNVRQLVRDGLSQRAASRATGISRTWVQRLCIGIDGPRIAAKPVRCECGALVQVVPCIACQARAHAKGCTTRRAA